MVSYVGGNNTELFSDVCVHCAVMPAVGSAGAFINKG